MADLEGSYHKVSSGSEDSQHVTSRRWLKVGVTLLGGSCLVLFVIVATSSSFPTLNDTNAAKSTNLFGFTTSVRAPTPAMKASVVGIKPFALNVNNMNKQGNSYGQSWQPLVPNLPSRFRSGNLAPHAGLFGFSNVFGEESQVKTVWQKGDKADFFSRSRNGWIPCQITDDSDQGVMVDVKPGVWITSREQPRLLRKRFGIKGYATDKGKDLELPQRSTDKQKELIKKQQELEKKFFR